MHHKFVKFNWQILAKLFYFKEINCEQPQINMIKEN